MISVFCGIKDTKSSFFEVVSSHDSDKKINETNTTKIFAEKKSLISFKYRANLTIQNFNSV